MVKGQPSPNQLADSIFSCCDNLSSCGFLTNNQRKMNHLIIKSISILSCLLHVKGILTRIHGSKILKIS